MIGASLGWLVLVASGTASAACDAGEVLRPLDEGFSKVEIRRMCGNAEEPRAKRQGEDREQSDRDDWDSDRVVEDAKRFTLIHDELRGKSP